MKHADTQGYATESTSRPKPKPKPSPDVVRSAHHEKSKNVRNICRNAVSSAVCKRRRENGTRPKPPAKACSYFSAVLSLADFETCRQSLIRSILRCNDLQFLYLSALFSSLLYCFRPLHRSEIIRMIYLHFATDELSQEDPEGPQSMFEQLQILCEDLLRVDSQGFVHFGLPTVKQFLLCYPIKGIDRSHFVLARACIAEIAAGQGLGSSRSEQSGSEEQTCFSAYAVQNWHLHYRNVQKESPGLTGQAHRILQTQIARRLSLADGHPYECTRLEHARRFCEEKGLSVLLEKYSQLLSQGKAETFPAYPSESSNNPDEEVDTLGETLARMTTDGSREESDSDWVLVV